MKLERIEVRGRYILPGGGFINEVRTGGGEEGDLKMTKSYGSHIWKASGG